MEEIEKIRAFVSRFEEIDGADDDTVIQKFNALLEESGKEYWFCKDCNQLHPRNWTHCDLPCVQYEHSKQITEEEWEQLNAFFDPTDYSMDDAHLQMPHSRLTAWLREAERVYQIKKGLRTFDIHNGPNSPQREHKMTDEERECWIAEIRAFMQAKQYRHRAWRDRTPTIKEFRPGNCRLEPVIRVVTVRNGKNEKIIERVEFVRA